MTEYNRLAAGLALVALFLFPACERQPSGQDGKTSGTSPATNAASTRSNAEAKADRVQIQGGRFMMGDKEQMDAPLHEVVLSPFLIDRYLVTQEQFQKIMGDNPSRWKGDKNPVEQVRWSDAVKFCNQRSQLEKLQPCYNLKTWRCDFDADGYRLPTEAEWEYACRAGSTTAFFFGDNPGKLSDYAWFEKNSGGRPQPVGQKQPNAWGLYDICGNVWEWCNDFYKVDYYKDSPQKDPRGPDEGQTKVVRGGAWRFKPESCRSGYRYNENPGYADVCFGYDIYGFRCVRKLASGSAR